jgi:hypothetical protein
MRNLLKEYEEVGKMLGTMMSMPEKFMPRNQVHEYPICLLLTELFFQKTNSTGLLDILQRGQSP